MLALSMSPERLAQMQERGMNGVAEGRKLFFGEELGGFLEAVFQFISELLAVGNRQFQHVPAACR